MTILYTDEQIARNFERVDVPDATLMRNEYEAKLAVANETIGNLQHELGIARAQIAELTDYKAVTEPMVAELQAQLQALGAVVDAQNRQLKAIYLTQMAQAHDDEVQP